MAKTPFHALGLAPSALAGKNDLQIKSLVKLVGRALAQIEHPDVAGGNTERFAAVQNALESLEDPEKFSKAKEQFLKPPKKQVDELALKLARRTRQLRYARHQVREYIQALAKVDAGPTVLRTGKLRLTLIDKARSSNRSAFDASGAAFVTLLLDDGLVVEERKGIKTQRARRLVGTVSSDAFVPPHHIGELIHACQAPRDVPSERRVGTRLSQRTPPGPARLTHSIPLLQAGPIVDLLLPEIKKYHSLFSLLFQDEVPTLYYEGTINKIE